MYTIFMKQRWNSYDLLTLFYCLLEKGSYIAALCIYNFPIDFLTKWHSVWSLINWKIVTAIRSRAIYQYTYLIRDKPSCCCLFSIILTFLFNFPFDIDSCLIFRFISTIHTRLVLHKLRSIFKYKFQCKYLLKCHSYG